jgi:hypothetical protein
MDVTLELVDHTSGEIFAQSEVPLESLPESFSGMETRLTVGDHEYDVVGAQPSMRDEIARTRRVVLSLRKVVAVDPKTILYSVSTLESELPPMAAGEVANALKVSPDDWRQVEWLRREFLNEITVELDDIAKIKQTHRTPAGFDAVHVRKRVGHPLRGAAIRRTELEAILGSKSRPLCLRGELGSVEGGFAIPDAEAMVYGVEQGGEVVCMGMFGYFADTVGKLHSLAMQKQLLMVDWCGTQCLCAIEEGFVDALASTAKR